MILLVHIVKQEADTEKSDRLGCTADPKFEVVKRKESLSLRD